MLNEHPVKLAQCFTLSDHFELVVSSLLATKIREIWIDVYSKWEMSRAKLIISQIENVQPKTVQNSC